MKCCRDLSKKKKKIEIMNSKMTTNSQLSTTGPQNKNKLSKQLEHNRITEMEITWRVISGVGGQMEGKVQGIRSIIGRYKIDIQNRQGEVKNSI